MKFLRRPNRRRSAKSHPARGAWIEIPSVVYTRPARASRTPQGVRGLKLKALGIDEDKLDGRTPQGVRGLKCSTMRFNGLLRKVAPRKGCVD